MHARGLRLRRVLRMLAIAHPSVLPSVSWYDVGTPVTIISQLNTLPACAPVNASMAALRLATHDSGSGWFASPFLYDSSIHYSTPVYPGALRSLLERWRAPLREVSNEKLETPEYASRWQTRYCVDSMLEHAVMHPIRHAFQLDELLKDL